MPSPLSDGSITCVTDATNALVVVAWSDHLIQQMRADHQN